MKVTLHTHLKHLMTIGIGMVLLIGGLWAAPAPAAEASKEANRVVAQDAAPAAEGRMPSAAIEKERALAEIDPVRQPEPYLKTLLELTEILQTLGYHQAALDRLTGAASTADSIADPAMKAAFHSALGDLYLSLKNLDDAMRHLEKAAEAAQKSDDPAVAASGLLGLGNFYTAVGYDGEALSAYEAVIGVIEAAGESVDETLSRIRAKALINLMRLFLKTDRFREATVAMDYAILQLSHLPEDPETAMDLLALYLVIRDFRQNPAVRASLERGTDARASLIRVSYEILTDALDMGRAAGDDRVLSYANGYLGQLYAANSRYNDAIRLTETAAFLAEEADAPELLYQWQWQLGRIHAAFGDRDAAIRSYRAAKDVLGPIRPLFFKGYRDAGNTFQRQIKPVYLELVDLILDGLRTLPPGEARRGRLREVRDVMESLKTAELEDFLEDECLTAETGDGLEHMPEGSALLYPIILPDKLALILTLPDAIRYVAVPVRSEKLEETVRRFRERLQTRSNHLYRHDARKIYDWLIRPVASALADGNIDTLIVAPDGVLRSIPFAALHDGEGFLVERFAIGAVPAIALTDLTPPARREGHEILLGGISKSVQDFPELPSVPGELAAIRRLMDGEDVLKDEDFTLDRITGRFQTVHYDVLHMATHGVFGGSADETFLLTHDGRLTLNRLRELIGLGRYRKHKVELITLSACQTALGDERATLGLAGVAVQAGVKSAIATLWFIDDEAASIAIREYYTHLKTGVSKVAALRNAQKHLIARKRYRHPAYWAPFLLIGNWL